VAGFSKEKQSLPDEWSMSLKPYRFTVKHLPGWRMEMQMPYPGWTGVTDDI